MLYVMASIYICVVGHPCGCSDCFPDWSGLGHPPTGQRSWNNNDARNCAYDHCQRLLCAPKQGERHCCINCLATILIYVVCIATNPYISWLEDSSIKANARMNLECCSCKSCSDCFCQPDDTSLLSVSHTRLLVSEAVI